MVLPSHTSTIGEFEQLAPYLTLNKTKKKSIKIIHRSDVWLGLGLGALTTTTTTTDHRAVY